MKLRMLVVVGVLLTSSLVAAVAHAETVGPIDFESPTYVTGSINGQDGWSSTGPYDHKVAAQSLYPSFGFQSLRISNAVTSGSFGDQTFSKSLANEAGEPFAANDGKSGGTRQQHFEAQWDFASTVPGAEQPGLSVVASPDRGDGARMSWIQMTDTPAGLEVNFSDYVDAAPIGGCDLLDDFRDTTVATGLDRTVPHTIKVTMDLIDGRANDVVKVYVDGVLLHTGASWEDYFRDCEGNPTRTVDSILFRTGGPAAPGTLGNGFLIDNLTLSSGPTIIVPETADDCKKGGWQNVTRADGSPFKNQGDCIQYVKTGK